MFKKSKSIFLKKHKHNSRGFFVTQLIMFNNQMRCIYFVSDTIGIQLKSIFFVIFRSNVSIVYITISKISQIYSIQKYELNHLNKYIRYFNRFSSIFSLYQKGESFTHIMIVRSQQTLTFAELLVIFPIKSYLPNTPQLFPLLDQYSPVSISLL